MPLPFEEIATYRGRNPALRSSTDARPRSPSLLAARGIGSGDRARSFAETSIAFFELLFGCAKPAGSSCPLTGACLWRKLTPLVPDAAPRLLVHALEDAGCPASFGA
jgi:fatty-acyl-CoA synthase